MSEPARCLIFDPFAGVSGDMLLAALLDVGVPTERLQRLVASLPVEATVTVSSVRRGTLTARAVRIDAAKGQPLRHLRDLLRIVESAPVDDEVRQRAARVLRRLAEVEAGLHGVGVDEVHFHELGAADTVVDVLGCCDGVQALGVTSCFTRPVALGHGSVQTEHGELPVPAPATLRLLEGVPVMQTGLEGELTTPTGAALLAELTAGRPAPGTFVPLESGFGAGARDPETHPNLLRVLLVQMGGEDELYALQSDIDDLSPEYVPPLLERLYASGAVDVCTHPVGMKKGRTGLRIEALVPAGRRMDACRLLLEESTTLGVRYWRVDREVLPRATKTIEWRGFHIRVKSSVTPGGHTRLKPEYDDVLQVARATGLPVLQIREAIKRKLDSENRQS